MGVGLLVAQYYYSHLSRIMDQTGLVLPRHRGGESHISASSLELQKKEGEFLGSRGVICFLLLS